MLIEPARPVRVTASFKTPWTSDGITPSGLAALASGWIAPPTDVADAPDVLAPFDRVVIATGARYRYGLGPIATTMLDRGAGRWPGFSRLLSASTFRDWFYYRARQGTADRFRRFTRQDQVVVAIGDAVQAGKSKPAIASAFEAALLP